MRVYAIHRIADADKDFNIRIVGLDSLRYNRVSKIPRRYFPFDSILSTMLKVLPIPGNPLRKIWFQQVGPESKPVIEVVNFLWFGHTTLWMGTDHMTQPGGSGFGSPYADKIYFKCLVHGCEMVRQ